MGMPIVGYANRLTARPGSQIEFMVSSEEPIYRASIVRLIHGDENPLGPGFRAADVMSTVDGEYDGRVQVLRPGSYVRIPHQGEMDRGRSFTLHLWLWATTPWLADQTLVARGDPGVDGFAVRLDKGRVTFRSGGASVRVSQPIGERVWYSVSVVVDADLEEVRIDITGLDPTRTERGQARGSIVVPSAIGEDVFFAAETAGPDGCTNFYNGKLEGLSLFSCALTEAEIAAVRAGSSSEHAPYPVALWDFSADINSWVVSDISGNGLHGQAFNKPMRGATGHGWDGSETAWSHVPEQYGAIHFHDDDLGDAGWSLSFRWLVPDDLRSGIYAAHVHNDSGEDYIPFAVRPPRGTSTARTVFLMPTFSYLAYGNEQMLNSDARPDKNGYPWQPQDQYVVENRLLSLYDTHSDGSGVCYSSRLRPIVNMRPKVVMPMLNGVKGSPHQFNADLHVIDWLDHFGYDVDVITDEDLHHDGEGILRPYSVVITGTHSEYWSGEMIDAAQAYLQSGGRMMHLAGNGMYWVTQLDPETGSSIEVRRRPPSTRMWETRPGEGYLSSTGELGGLWRYRGRAPQTWVGVGFTAETTGQGRPYRRLPDSHDPRARFVFDGIESDELIGDFACLVNSYGAAGFEIDRADPALGTPTQTLVLATADDFDDDAQAVTEEVMLSDSLQGGTVNPKVRADMVLIEYPHGGAVWTPASITWGGCLSYDDYDNNVSRVTRNVLDAFLKGGGLWPHGHVG